MPYELHSELIGIFQGLARYRAPRGVRGLGTRHLAAPRMLTNPSVPRSTKSRATVRAVRRRNRLFMGPWLKLACISRCFGLKSAN